MTTYKFLKLPDGRYRTTIESDFGTVRALIESLTERDATRAAREAAARRAAWRGHDRPRGTDFAAHPVPGTTLADEDACRRVDDVDQDGPDCEGPEGGESA